MKNLVLFFGLSTFAFNAFATTHCYEATSKVPQSLSPVFCFASANLNYDNTSLILEGNSNHLPGSLKIISSSRHNEERLNFVASTLLFHAREDGCGEGEKAILNIAGLYNSAAILEISPADLEISVEYSYLVDTCHSSPQVQLINYKFIY